MRIRCSKGLRISAFFGHFFIRSTDLLALPACDADKVRGQGEPGTSGGMQEGSRLPGGLFCWTALTTSWPGQGAGCGPCRTPHLCAHFPNTLPLPFPPPRFLSSPQSFSVEIAHEETLLTGQVAYLQAALLYTNSLGERRIRVHTLAMPVVSGAPPRCACACAALRLCWAVLPCAALRWAKGAACGRRVHASANNHSPCLHLP